MCKTPAEASAASSCVSGEEEGMWGQERHIRHSQPGSVPRSAPPGQTAPERTVTAHSWARARSRTPSPQLIQLWFSRVNVRAGVWPLELIKVSYGVLMNGGGRRAEGGQWCGWICSLLWMIQAIHCVAVFSLDVEHKEEDGGDAVKTEVRFLLCWVFVLGADVTLEVSFTHARAAASFVFGVN